MRHLDATERTRRISLVERLLVYNLIGEAIYLPFGSEKDGVTGVRAGKFGIFSAQNLLALIANGDARDQFEREYPEQFEQLCERSLNQNDVETYVSELASQARRHPSPSPPPVAAPRRAPASAL